MRDVLAAAAAVFEPEEVAVLAQALRLALKKLGADRPEDTPAEVARLVHNLARSRIRLRKPIRTEENAAEIANEAVELFTYLEEAPDAVLAASRESSMVTRNVERSVGIFPRAFRDVPVSRL